MKNYFLILALFATMLVGCDKPNDPQPEAKKPVIMLDKSSVQAKAEGEMITLNYTIENPQQDVELALSEDAEWIDNVAVTESAITFDVAQNELYETREAQLTLLYEGAESVSVAVSQLAAEDPTIILTKQTLNCTLRPGYEGLGADRYFLGFSSGATFEAPDGTLIPTYEDDIIFYCAFYGEPADLNYVVIPEGTYSLNGEDKVLGNLDPYYTYTVRNNGVSEPLNSPATDATVTVKRVDGEVPNYVITFDYTFENGEQLKARYEGDIFIQVSTPLTAPTPWMEEDYDADFVGVYAKRDGGSQLITTADLIVAQLYDCQLDENGAQSGGIVVRLELTAPKLEGMNPMIPDGVYNVSMNSELFSTPVGDVINLGDGFGGITMMGTAARVMDENGKYYYGAVLSGAVTVESNGLEEQTISVDLMTGMGQHITGSYTGPVTIDNYYYQPPISDDPYSTLEGDMEIVADDNWSFKADYYQEYYHNRTDVSMIRFRGYNVANPDLSWEPFFGFRFDLIVPNDGNITLPAGTYRPDTNAERKPMTFEVGSRRIVNDEGTYYEGSYCYLGYDWLGFIDSTNMAPAIDGSLVITAYGDDEYGIQYYVTDDRGNIITFSHRGKVKIVKY
jgi:hypothetical protein